MKYLFYLSFYVGIAAELNAQETNRNNLSTIVTEVKSVDMNAIDLKDLQPIKKAIGNSQIVVLGEQDHGDGTSMAAKARLVKFLHDKMGFKVLAFEVDAYSLLSLQKSENLPFYIDSVKANIHPFWAQTKEMQELWQYLTSNRDLKIVSFDIGLNTNHVKQNSEKELYSKVELLPFAKQEPFLPFKNTLNSLLQGKPAQDFNASEKETFFKSINELTYQAKQQFPNDELLKRQLYALLAKAEHYWLRTYREKHMAANLNWLIKEKYPNEKVIVWTANFHAVNDIYAVVENNPERLNAFNAAVDKDSVETMIQILRRDNDLSIYSLNMISVSGMFTPTAWTSITNPADSIRIPAGNIEKQVADLKGNYYFIDLKTLPKDHWMQHPIPMIAMLHRNTYRARWPKVFDGLFFIRNMKPLTPLQ